MAAELAVKQRPFYMDLRSCQNFAQLRPGFFFALSAAMMRYSAGQHGSQRLPDVFKSACRGVEIFVAHG